ncbi:hypothetical protein CBG40_21690 [Mycobacterium tuberculosis]|nr:hypothetical protein CBG40_21690 [Mycobacterium tuberculosis]
MLSKNWSLRTCRGGSLCRCGVGAVVYGGGGVGGLAADLRASASSFDAVIAGLAAGPWSGPASVAMAGRRRRMWGG